MYIQHHRGDTKKDSGQKSFDWTPHAVKIHKWLGLIAFLTSDWIERWPGTYTWSEIKVEKFTFFNILKYYFSSIIWLKCVRWFPHGFSTLGRNCKRKCQVYMPFWKLAPVEIIINYYCCLWSDNYSYMEIGKKKMYMIMKIILL